jgi:GTPase SAR1 family protein
MRIIAIIGPNSCGKTTTLNLVYQELLNASYKSTIKQPLGGNPNDFSDILVGNGKKIAIFTMGDYSTPLVNAILNYENQNCDFLICACNTNRVKPQSLISKYLNNIFIKTKQNGKQAQTIDNYNVSQSIISFI